MKAQALQGEVDKMLEKGTFELVDRNAIGSIYSLLKSTVNRALNDRRMNIREASERARNRNEWRMIVTQF